MAKEALTKIKDLSKEDVVAKMRSGELVPPKKGPERDEFFRFINMKKEERENYVSEGTPAIPENKDEPAKPEPTPAKKSEEKSPESAKPWYAELGYEDETKAREAHKNLLDLTSKLQNTVDKLNADGGKRGNELKRLLEEKDRLTKELETFKKTTAPAPTVKPQKPKRPNPKEFENGAFDENYVDLLAKYEADMDLYLEKNTEWIQESTKRAVLESLPKATEVTPQPTTSAWEKFFDQDIPEFQKRFNLATTVPVRRISDSYNTVAPESKANPQEKLAAQQFLASVPKSDLDVYAKVKNAVEVAYDFSDGVPQSRYKTIEGALFDNGLIGEGKPFNTVKPVQLSAEDERSAREKAQHKNNQTETTIPASQMAGGDKKISDYQSPDEKKKRYRDLLTMYNNALNESGEAGKRFEKTEEWKEYLTLRSELGLKKPMGY